MTRKLVEEDNVFLLSGLVGTPTNTAVWHYLNDTSSADFQMIKQARMRRFNGERYVPFGPIRSGATVS